MIRVAFVCKPSSPRSTDPDPRSFPAEIGKASSVFNEGGVIGYKHHEIAVSPHTPSFARILVMPLYLRSVHTRSSSEIQVPCAGFHHPARSTPRTSVMNQSRGGVRTMGPRCMSCKRHITMHCILARRALSFHVRVCFVQDDRYVMLKPLRRCVHSI